MAEEGSRPEGQHDRRPDGDPARLPVPVHGRRPAVHLPRAAYALRGGVVPPRVGTALDRIRPAWPVLARGAAMAATVGAAGFVAVKVGPRLAQRVAQLPGPAVPARPLPARPIPARVAPARPPGELIP